ncbi:MAG: AgmX/PglI C-terminal domain-containing protein [Polyangiaceae bacterium]
MRNTYLKLLLCAGLLMVLAACGAGPAAGPVAPAQPDPVAESGAGSGALPQVSQELGSINQDAVEKNFDRLQGKIQSCFKAGASRIDYLDGDVAVFLRIGLEGHVKYTYFESSDVGDRETEKCILGVISAADWPKPQGGEAEVRKSFGFDAGDARAPTAWNSDKAAAAIGKAQGAIDKCKDGVSGAFKGAAYVQPDGKKGKVQAVGLAAPSKEGADKIDCLIGVIQGLELPSPGSYVAKFSFTL